jgi:hypothetical protein
MKQRKCLFYGTIRDIYSISTNGRIVRSFVYISVSQVVARRQLPAHDLLYGISLILVIVVLQIIM